MLSAGILRKKILKIYTFEAGMCMKTNKIMTKCPKKVGHFCLSFGHFRLTDTNSAEFRREFTVKRGKCRTRHLGSPLGRSERENPGQRRRNSRRQHPCRCRVHLGAPSQI